MPLCPFRSLAPLIAACFLALTGCGQTETEDLVVMWGLEARITNPLLAQFLEETGITVRPTLVPYASRFEKIATAGIAGAGGFDVVMVDTIWIPQFASAGWIADVSGDFSEADTSGIFPGMLDSLRFGGRLYGLPMYTDAKFFYYNQAHFQAAGITAPPANFEQFTEYAIRLTREVDGRRIWGTVWAWKQAEGLICDWMLLAHAIDPAPLFDEQGRPRFTESGGVRALEWMVDLLHRHKAADPASMTFTENEVRDHFLSGRSAMMFNWEGVVTKEEAANQQQAAADIRRALVPTAAPDHTTSILGPEGMAIMASTSKREQAIQLLRFLTRPEVQKQIYDIGRDLPIQRQVLIDAASAGGDEAELIRRQLEEAVARPALVHYSRISDILQAEIHRALLQEKTPRQALDDAAQRIGALVRDAS